MTLHRTPVHRDALDLVRRGQFMWRAAGTSKTVGVPCMPAGFAYSNGRRLAPGELLVALYELRDARLLHVDGALVRLTADGQARLAEWDATRQAVKR